jgi:hypothetical protein
MRRAKEDAPTSSEGTNPIADDSSASPPDTGTRPDEERPSASDDLGAAADLVRPTTLDPHTAADLILDAEAHSCVPNDSFCYVCEVQLDQRAGRRV